MIKRYRPIRFLWLIGAIQFAAPVALAVPDKPNIVLIFSDDQGWADLGIHGVVEDVRTPNLDMLAAQGVRFSDAYVTAPQCVPSRAALMTGMYAQRFGVDTNVLGPLPLGQATIAERIRDQGYTTGMVGKWHLVPYAAQQEWIAENLEGDWSNMVQADLLPYRSYNRGFTEAFEGNRNTGVRATFDLDGNQLPLPTVVNYPDEYRIELQTKAALSFIDTHQNEPFFLYVSYFAPHVPLEAPQEYLARFPGEMPERRRYALAMMAAIDDGVGEIVSRLEQYDLTNDTIVMFISDNGAPLKLHKEDKPIEENSNVWNGSLNDPFVGEKAIVTEGGVRVPFIASWPGTLPQGVVYNEPVVHVDASATAVSLAGGDITSMDGKNLMPHLTGQTSNVLHDLLFWRKGAQEAVRQANWKLIRLARDQVWLFDLSVPRPERVNLASQNPQVVDSLTAEVESWVATLQRPTRNNPNAQEATYYAFYLPPLLPGDFDVDGDVDGNDFLIWQAGFGTVSGATHRIGDADGDEDVDGNDFLIWQDSFGGTLAGAAASAAMPPLVATAFAVSESYNKFVRKRPFGFEGRADRK